MVTKGYIDVTNRYKVADKVIQGGHKPAQGGDKGVYSCGKPVQDGDKSGR